jgi:phosphatidylinositol transfer protein SFH5
MELALQKLNIAAATVPITAEYDPYKIYQVHDYKSVAFFSQSSTVRVASKETINVFTQNYPELLKEKFFINVPMVMGFMYGVIKMFVAAKTAKKFHPMSNGGGLAREFGTSKVEKLGDKLPKAYGGTGEDLDKQGKIIELV